MDEAKNEFSLMWNRMGFQEKNKLISIYVETKIAQMEQEKERVELEKLAVQKAQLELQIMKTKASKM